MSGSTRGRAAPRGRLRRVGGPSVPAPRVAAGSTSTVARQAQGHPHSDRARRRRLRSLLALVLAVALLGAAAWVVLGSGLLGLRRVVVEGERQVGEQTLRRLVRVAPGTPLARVDTDAVAAAVAGVPQVAHARVERRWPDTLAVVVTERVPFAVVAQGRRLRVLDRAGVAFADADADAPRGLPLVAGTLRGEGRAALDAALDVVAALPPATAALVVRVSAASPDSVQLSLKGGREVVWGDSRRNERKAAVLTALLSPRPGATPVTVVDVSAPDAPTTRR